jgi:enoyl-CoA hydratase/carnithine racemase
VTIAPDSHLGGGCWQRLRSDIEFAEYKDGTGDYFSGPRGTPATAPTATAQSWEPIRSHGTHLLGSLLDIEAVIISAINGPAYRHAELPLLADIVLASEDACFQDSGHLPSRLTPGDGMHFIMPLLLGLNRGRYFLLTGQTIAAHEAKELGLVAEVLPRDQLLPRARQLAAELSRHNPLTLRYTRLLMTESLRRATQDLHGLGLALEGLAAIDETVAGG